MTRVALCGLGTIGRSAARLLLDSRDEAEVVGATTLEEEAVGRPLGEFVQAHRAGPVVSASLDEVLETAPDVIIVTAGTSLKHMEPLFAACLGQGVNVISSSEQLFYPVEHNHDVARRLDELAKSRGVTLLGTGMNPGFVFDGLVLALSGVCWDVDFIHCRRAVDASGYGKAIHERLGIGHDRDSYDQGHANGRITGHAGFPESIELVCRRLGIEPDGEVEEWFDPYFAETPVQLDYGEIPAGHTEGFAHVAAAKAGGRERIRLELIFHVRPEEAGLELADTITIDGIHSVSLTIKPGLSSILGTAAELVNAIPSVIQAPPGLKTVKDLPVAAAWLAGQPAALLPH